MINKKAIFRLSILGFWAVVIFLFSNSNSAMSTAQTQVAINFLFELAEKNTFFNSLISILSENHELFYSIRKLAHLTIFCVLQLISFWVLRNSGKSIIKSSIYSILIVIGYATFDEIHQYFVPGRSCQIRDVFIDTLGGCAGLLICYITISIKKCLKFIFNLFKTKEESIG